MILTKLNELLINKVITNFKLESNTPNVFSLKVIIRVNFQQHYYDVIGDAQIINSFIDTLEKEKKFLEERESMFE